jgi:uncharacterized membrane protein
MASVVEFVEALTIVLAVGVTRGWRSALVGTVAGLAALVALILALGRSLSAVPLPLLQLVVGLLLLMFGLRWLHKAVLRAAGVVPLHDENQAFAHQTEALRGVRQVGLAALDKIALVTTFKTVMLEGIEVVFIVIALGASRGHLVPASLGALLALLLVVGLGLWLHRPLANVPENSLKFGVGVMLAAFGTFWVGEGIGLAWPGEDAAILVLIAVFLTVGLGLARVCKRLYVAVPVKPATRAAQTATAGLTSSGLTWIGSELLGLFVGDLWLAAGVMVWVIGAWAVEARYGVAAGVACSLFAAGLAAMLAVSTVRHARQERGRWQ